MPERTPRGLFVGLTTLDVVQLVERLPAPDEKVRALDDMLAAGGPAANAAVGFAALGGDATLLTRAPDGPAWQLIAADLDACGVRVVRAPSATLAQVTTASILVTAGTGERAVVSSQDRAHLADAAPPDPTPVLDLLEVDGFDVVEVDGHHADLAEPILRRARAAGVPTLLDGGSWKPSTPRLLPFVDVAAVSGAFRPVELDPRGDVLAYLRTAGPSAAVVTRGSEPVIVEDAEGRRDLPVEPVAVVDTLGAGDFFHAGMAHHLALHGMVPLDDSVRAGAELAARSIASFGTRAWLR